MIVNGDQANDLLANQSEKDLRWKADWNFTDRTAAIVREDNPSEEVMEVLFKGDDTAFSDGDLDLAAAAPDLAQTVIAQAEQIEAIRWSYQQFERFLERFHTDFAKALGREDLLGTREDAADCDQQTIYELSLDAVYKAREAGVVYKAPEGTA